MPASLKARSVGAPRALRLGLAIILIWPALGQAISAAVVHPLVAPRPGPIDQALHIVAADFNRDGFDDLATANFQAGTITILINQRDGTFAPQAFSPVPVGPAALGTQTAGPLYMTVADLNPDDADSDGIPNALDDCPNVYNPKGPTGTQLDTDNNGVGDACQPKVPADIDQDGYLDYDKDNPAHFLDNCPLFYNPSQAPINGDGVGDACRPSPDIVVVEKSLSTGYTTGIMRVRLNLGDGSFTSRPSYATQTGPAAVVAADWNGDGLTDLLLSNSANDTLQLHAGIGDATFANQTYLTAGDGPEGLAVGDFDGNGRVDVAAANRGANTVGIYFNPDAPAGMGLPGQPSILLATQAQPTEIYVGRLGGASDTFDDLLVLDQGGSGAGKVEVFLGPLPKTQSALSPSKVIDLGAGHRPRGAALRDFDLDGLPDLAVADFTFDQVLIYKGAGDGSFTLAATLGPVDQPGAIAGFDYDPQDPAGPDPDLAVLAFGTTTVELFRNDGAMNFVRAPTSPITPWKQTTGLSLFGADDTTGNDLLLLHRVPARLDVLAGIGNPFFRATPSIPLLGPTCTLMSGPTTCADGMIEAELLADGVPDLLITDTLGNKVTVVTGTFGGFPTEKQTLPVASDPIGSAVGPLVTLPGDYDKDGVPDTTDNCPGRYNPPGCKVTDAGCEVTELCTLTDANGDPLLEQDQIIKTDCLVKDPVTQQCDSDGNGVGDQCQLLAAPANASCENLDTDGDAVPDFNKDPYLQDYDSDFVLNAIDNCPTVSNPTQLDGNANGIGDACEKRNTDYDGDTVQNLSDNCPTVRNSDQKDLLPLPYGNGIGDNCETPSQIDTDIDGKPNYDINFDTPGYMPTLTGAARVAAALDNCRSVYNPSQQDNNGNAIGDACEEQVDADFDGVPDYDIAFDAPGYQPLLIGKARIAAALDNCPTISNPGQQDNNDDNVGNNCNLKAALDNCPWIVNGQQSDVDGNGIGDACSTPPNDIVVVSGTPGALTILLGDGSGSFREASFSPVTVLPSPSAALVGPFSLSCVVFNCQTKPTSDIVLAQHGTLGTSLDDRLKLYLGNGTGVLIPQSAVPAQGDPSALLSIPSQPICADPHFAGTPDPGIRYDQTNLSPVIVALEPGTSTLGIYLVSNNGLESVPANPVPLPVPPPLVDMTFVDLNRDAIQDLLALSSGDGDPATPNLTIYMGLGNGLFYTDPTFNPDTLKDGWKLITTGFIDIQIDNTYPDVVVFDDVDGAPTVLLNSLPDRADIDESGRVDGFDLALLANAFGASRGEDFIIQADGTLLQSGSGYRSVLVGSGIPQLGQDKTSPKNPCDHILQPMSGPSTVPPTPPYGLPVDINLDGVVDGTDLALLAIQFGRRLQH